MDVVEFRLVRHKDTTGKEMYRIHQIWFDGKGNPTQISEPITPEHESTETLTHILIHMMGALTKQTIDASIFTKAVEKDNV